MTETAEEGVSLAAQQGAGRTFRSVQEYTGSCAPQCKTADGIGTGRACDPVPGGQNRHDAYGEKRASAFVR